MCAQSWYNHSELIWKTFETKHFIFYYHEGTEKTVSEAAFVAEKIYKPITEYYDFYPETKTAIVIKDTDDISNGTAFYYDNKLEIWSHPLDFDLRGSHRWLQNVITHEFTHIIQIGSAMKASTRFPAFYIQGFTYEDEKRDDVLYGYPNSMFSIPIPGVAVPPWVAEGTAQYMSPDLYYDFWDSHRDMLLRDLTLNNKLLSFHEMNSFGKKGIGGEAVYNQGFSFSNYLSDRFGSQILPKISNILSSKTFSINKAIFESTDSKYNGYTLYSDWVKKLNEDYNQKLENVYNNSIEGDIIQSKGTTNLFPKWSPNGDKIAFISNQDNDYFGQTDLFIYSFKDSTKIKLIPGAKYAPSWVNDSTLIFTLRSEPNKHGSRYFDIYKMSLNQKEPDQLTEGMRFRSPCYNQENNLIAAISTVDGLSDIYVSDLDSIDFVKMTNFNNQEYISSINWNNNKILMDVVSDHGRDIYELNLDTEVLTKIIDESNDIRNPVFDGETLYFSQDYNGIFNIGYQNGGEFKFLTNVFGGAFMPDIQNGRMVYSLYKNGGYKISIIDNLEDIETNVIGYTDYDKNKVSHLEVPTDLDFDKTSKPYSGDMSELHIVPRVMLDYNTLKYGVYVFSDDIVGTTSLFGGFSINEVSDVDAMLMLEYKKFNPTLYFNFFWASRNTEQKFDYYTIDGLPVDNIDIRNDVEYHLFSSDLGMRFPNFNCKFWLNYNYTIYNQKIFQAVTQEFINNGEEEQKFGYAKLGFDYYKGHTLSLRTLKKKIKPHFLGHMLTDNGYIFDLTFSYEWNSFIEGISLNEDYGTYGANLEPNNTFRLNFLFTKFDNFKDIIFIENSFRLDLITDKKVDDFFYFFGGGMPGLKGYTFYDSNLTGWSFIMHSIYFRKLLLNSQYLSFKDFIGFNKLSLGFVTQGGYMFVAEGEDISPDKDFKFSSGIELRSKGFLFYGYPAAVTLEHHYPISNCNTWWKEGKTYIKFLFDF